LYKKVLDYNYILVYNYINKTNNKKGNKMARRNYIQKSSDNGSSEMKRLFTMANEQITILELQLQNLDEGELKNEKNHSIRNEKRNPIVEKIEKLKEAKLNYIFSLFANGCIVE